MVKCTPDGSIKFKVECENEVTSLSDSAVCLVVGVKASKYLSLDNYTGNVVAEHHLVTGSVHSILLPGKPVEHLCMPHTFRSHESACAQVYDSRLKRAFFSFVPLVSLTELL